MEPMAATGIEGTIESISEAVVLLEPDDLNGLADLHSQLQALDEWAGAEGHSRTAKATTALCEIVEQIILQDYPDPAAGIALLTDSMRSIQQLSRNQSTDGHLDFPTALGIPPNGNGTPPPASSSSDASLSPAPIHTFTVQLPAYVDESIFSEFLTRQVGVLEEVESAILEIEKGDCTAPLGALNRHLHTLKGEAAMLGLEDIEHLCHVAEDVLELEHPPLIADRLLALTDWLRMAFEAYAGNGNTTETPSHVESMLRGDLPVGPAPGTPAPDTATFPENSATFSPGPLTGDPELIADFVVEAMEHLETSDIQVLKLETEPKNLDAINAIFRAFHTIKGVCGFIALDELGALAHEAENLLDLARKDVLLLEGPCLDCVFDAIDMLKRLVTNVRDALERNVDLTTEPELPALITRLQQRASGEAPGDVPDTAPDDDLVASNLGEILIQMGSTTADDIERALDTQIASEGLPKKLGQVLQENALTSSVQINDALRRQQTGEAGEKLGEILVEMGAVTQADVKQSLRKQEETTTRPKLGEVLVASGTVSAREVSQALRIQKQQNAPKPAEAGSDAPSDAGGVAIRETVKVDAHRLDQLVDMIGELVIAESMVCQSRELADNLSTDLTRHVSQLDKITRELQEMAMGLRMVPVRATFQKMARLVRDLARKTGKEVSFNMRGEDTELDKTVVDRISDPLVHMVRNSVDHGLEKDAEARRAAGKPAAGTVTLRAYHSGGNIQIEISDDGQGLNRAAILNKAQERGLIEDSGDAMTDKEVWQLIFEPGFSTAATLTEVSGRGVGMDVVKRNIEALRGEIDIHSEAGVGSRFTIQLPLTLAIIDGMVVRVGVERYIIPTLSIIVSVRPAPIDLHSVVGAIETMKLQGEIIPLLRLHALFDLSGAIEDPTKGTVVVLENSGRRVGLLIDEILGQQQIVIKSIGETLKGTPGIAGGAIMPDGQVGLILDIPGVVRLATEASLC